jgi:hypothetical protein
MDLVEALADAIQRFEGWIPASKEVPRGSRAWRNRNPGNLRPFDRAQPTDEANYRKFPTLANGWEALRADISAKLAGSHGLTDGSTLRNFFDIYAPSDDSNDPDKYARQVANWLTIYLATPISAQSTLRSLKVLPLS